MKPGWQTSEALAALLGTATIALNKKIGLELTTQDVLAIVGLLGSFIGSRWHLKIKQATEDAVAAKATAP